MNIVMKIIHKMYAAKSMRIYGEYYENNKKSIEDILNLLKMKNEDVIIWGAGLKGTAFLKTFDKEQKYIKGIYDIDRSKVGTRTVTNHLILDYKSEENHDTQTILLMNNNYETEVAGMIQKERIHARLINIDSIILGKLNMEMALNMYGEYL